MNETNLSDSDEMVKLHQKLVPRKTIAITVAIDSIA